MGRERCVDGLMNAVNVFILLMIVLLYVVTGTGLGDDAVAALSSGTIYRGGGEGLVALECAVSWDAQALPDMLELLRERGVRLSGVNPLAKYGSMLTAKLRVRSSRNTTARIAEMLVQGNTRGMVKSMQNLRAMGVLDPKVSSLSTRLLQTEQANIEEMKHFL